MYNAYQFNTALYNATASPSTDEASTNLLVFENFSISDTVTYTVQELLDSGASRDIIDGNSTRKDGQYIAGDFYRDRIIEAQGYIKASTAQGLIDAMDNMRKYLRTREGNLDVTYLGDSDNRRRYISTLINPDTMFAERKGYHITLCPFKVRFKCHTPFGKKTSYSSDTETITTSPTNKVVSSTGTIHAEGVFLLIFDSLTTGSAVTITNTTTGESITHTRDAGNYSPADVLIFDGENKQVTLNSVPVPYTGAFPRIDVGSNNIQFEVTGSSYSISATIKWRDTFL